MSDHEPRQGWPEGLVPALACAVLMLGAFVLATASTVMPAAERWAALTTFGLLALAYTLQGSPGLYDALGRVVRSDPRALVPLVLLVPALYSTYGLAVDEFSWNGLLVTLAFVALPAFALVQSRDKRLPTFFDALAALALLLSLGLGLVPALPLPQQGGVVGFFALAAVPLLLVLLAARGWPGLGFIWFINGADLRIGLLMAGGLLALLGSIALAFGFAQPAAAFPGAIELLVLAVNSYFLGALPAEIFFRGFIQNGIERFIEGKAWRGPGSQSRQLARWVSLVLAALLFGLMFMSNELLRLPPFPGDLLIGVVAGLGFGRVYQITGRVTASAVPHMLLLWGWSAFFM